jgi:uncharacterized membrane protein YcaP (DUF421 family)
MEPLYVALTSLLSIVVLFLLAKLMGDKQISQMSIFDYINGITLGSIAAELATELESPIQPLVAMIIYGLSAFLISFVTSKSLKLRNIINGKPIVLMENGLIYRDNFKKAHLDLSEFLMFCRVSGYFDLSQIQTALLERNGSVSILPTSGQRPATPSDFNLTPPPEPPATTVLLDGHILTENLKRAGQNVTWLTKELKRQGYSSPQEVFLAMCSGDSQLSVFPMTTKKTPSSRFE